MQIMKFKDWLRLFDLRESLKDSELNRILDKISDGFKLTKSERNFLDKFDNIKEDELKDYTHLSKVRTYEKIRELLDQNKKVVCDLYDRNGKIGLYITSIINNYEDDTCVVILKGGEKVNLTDNHLYNLIYNFQKEEYSLQSQDEYYETIPVNEN